MKYKRILRFYYGAGELDCAINNLIIAGGCASGNHPCCGERYAQKLCGLIQVKIRLGELWEYVDGVVKGMTERDRAALRIYAKRRGGKPTDDERRELRRAATKFARRAKRLCGFKEVLKLLDSYASLCG